MSPAPCDPHQLPFEIDEQIDPSLVTARAGVPLVLELMRRLGVTEALNTLVRIKQRQRGLRPSQLVETLVALWAARGDRCQDLTTFRTDAALAALLGYELPAATTMREFSEAFHAEALPLWQAGDKAAIPQESAPLQGLGQATRTLLAAVQRHAPQPTATLDADATILKSHKRTATVAYDGTTGYQPVLVLWAEADVIVHDEFRDGWQPEREEAEALRDWAEVPYVPDDGDARKDRPCVRRYLAVRVRNRQGTRFTDGREVVLPRHRHPPCGRWPGGAALASGAGRDGRARASCPQERTPTARSRSGDLESRGWNSAS